MTGAKYQAATSPPTLTRNREPLGIALYKASHSHVQQKVQYGAEFYIPQIIYIIEMDSRAAPKTVVALVNRLDMALELEFFGTSVTVKYGNCSIRT